MMGYGIFLDFRLALSLTLEIRFLLFDNQMLNKKERADLFQIMKDRFALFEREKAPFVPKYFINEARKEKIEAKIDKKFDES
jgi:hypothetical protein